jgi:endoglucanase
MERKTTTPRTICRAEPSTSGSESFFNSADVSGNLQIRDPNSGLVVIVKDASTADGAPLVTAEPTSLGNGSKDDEWQLLPTSNGYYRLVNTKSGLGMAVENASRADGAPIVQFAFSYGTGNYEWLIQHTDRGTYNFINRLSGLFLEVPGGSSTPGTQVEQASYEPGRTQQFTLAEDAPKTGPSAKRGNTISPGTLPY